MNNDYLQFANPDFTIDLHEFRNPEEALEFLERELYKAYQNSCDFVRVIHGIGSGVMKDRVTHALQNNPQVHEFSLEESGGSTMVKL
ncbi:MAG: hypothetical protein COX80_03300 [Candidatus Magasanikbacteria bacterium CG_4_10_14_0_2_um_filter_33_14]|uniref:Smr domain-containing protein n=1 Tax=Candidatus Magasanikbacteria bacterium CG_4_10_14_0_2_um_filter_33_14 TaxID=1974636 RepID=A0A2M7VA80_9BACT|nr:MAG: hypothetical protein COX80_03300 [Candidatus Magasanikbacteria bacterium CG_4_10_14_0_2_um_filter_33_14]